MSFDSRRRRPEIGLEAPSQALPAPPSACVVSLFLGCPERWKLRGVVDVYARQSASGFRRGGSDYVVSRAMMSTGAPPVIEPGRRREGFGRRRERDVPRASRRGRRRGLGLGLRRSETQRRLALAPHPLEQRVRELPARVKPRGFDRLRRAVVAAGSRYAAVREPCDDRVDRRVVRLRWSRDGGAVVGVRAGHIACGRWLVCRVNRWGGAWGGRLGRGVRSGVAGSGSAPPISCP